MKNISKVVVAFILLTIWVPSWAEIITLVPLDNCSLLAEGAKGSVRMSLKGERSTERACSVYLSKKEFDEKFSYCGVGGISVYRNVDNEWCYVAYPSFGDEYYFAWTTDKNISCQFSCIVK